MSKWRKRPVEVKVFRFGLDPIPIWAEPHIQVIPGNPDVGSVQVGIINTLEGTMSVKIGDFIIQDVDGGVYPCKPDIFFKTYEEIT